MRTSHFINDVSLPFGTTILDPNNQVVATDSKYAIVRAGGNQTFSITLTIPAEFVLGGDIQNAKGYFQMKMSDKTLGDLVGLTQVMEIGSAERESQKKANNCRPINPDFLHGITARFANAYPIRVLQGFLRHGGIDITSLSNKLAMIGLAMAVSVLLKGIVEKASQAGLALSIICASPLQMWIRLGSLT